MKFKLFLALLSFCSFSKLYPTSSFVAKNTEYLALEWRELVNPDSPKGLGGFLEVYAKNLPLDKGFLTLTYSTSLWERIETDKSAGAPNARQIVNPALDRSLWEIYDKYPKRICLIPSHTQPCLYYLPGERITVECFNDNRSWSQIAVLTPHPLTCSKNDMKLSAELLSIEPLTYRFEFSGFTADEVLSVTAKTSKRIIQTKNNSMGQIHDLFDFDFEDETLEDENFIEVLAEISSGTTLTIQLPTLKHVYHLCNTSNEQMFFLEKE